MSEEMKWGSETAGEYLDRLEATYDEAQELKDKLAQAEARIRLLEEGEGYWRDRVAVLLDIMAGDEVMFEAADLQAADWGFGSWQEIKECAERERQQSAPASEEEE